MPIKKVFARSLIVLLLLAIVLGGCITEVQQATITYDATSSGWTIITPRPVVTHTPTETLFLPTEEPQLSATVANPSGTPTVSEITNTATAPTGESNACYFKPGEVQLDGFESEILNEQLSFRIYLPPCYESEGDERYPVLYLLHGLDGTYDQWVHIGVDAVADQLIITGEIAPMIIVMPGEPYFNSIGDSIFDEVVMQELIPYVDAHYHSRTERSWRAIGGLSRGAAWALRIGVDNWRSFSAIGTHSLPLIRSERERLLAALVNIPKGLTPRLFMDIGNHDPELIYAQLFEEALTDNNIPHTWYMFVGRHEESYWREHLAIYLLWYAEEWTTGIR